MLDEGTVLGQFTVRCGTVLHSLEVIFGLKLSMCVACMILLELNNMNCVKKKRDMLMLVELMC